jgi:anti-sigma factor RsiW
MIASIHPTPDQLVAYADGETLGIDSARIAAHLERCAECRDSVTTLDAVRLSLKQTGERAGSSTADSGWMALSTRIVNRRRRRTIGGAAAAALLAASFVGVFVLRVPPDRADAPAATSSRTLGAATDLSRVVEQGRQRLPSAETRAMDAVVGVIDTAIQQTQSELASKPADLFLRGHLADLRRKRASALEDFVGRIRDRG